MGPLEAVLGRSWALRGWSWDLWRRSGAALEASGRGLGWSGGLWARFLAALGASKAKTLGPLLGHLRAVPGRSWAILGRSWATLGAHVGGLEASWAGLGTISCDLATIAKMCSIFERERDQEPVGPAPRGLGLSGGDLERPQF